jgi:hypothetical protein
VEGLGLIINMDARTRIPLSAGKQVPIILARHEKCHSDTFAFAIPARNANLARR